MKKNSDKQIAFSCASQHLGYTFQDIRRGTGLDPSVANSSLWQMNKDGQVKREGKCRSYRYTLIDTTTITGSDPLAQHHQRPDGANPVTNLLNQYLMGVRK